MAENDPHVAIPTLDNNVHIVPRITLTQIIHGDRPIADLDDWQIIVRSIMAEWLKNLREV